MEYLFQNEVALLVLTGVLALGIGIAVLAYTLPLKYVVPPLILLAPFQLFLSRYGSSSVALTYLVAIGVLMAGKFKRLPLLGAFGLVLLAQFMSLSQVHRAIMSDHLVYIINSASAYLVFYMAYNYARGVEDVRKITKLLLILNTIIVVYCYLQLVVGLDQVSLFGIERLKLTDNREDLRLSGPFNAVGITSEYLVISIYFVAFVYLYSTGARLKWFLVGLVMINFAFMVATGNRGGVLILIGGFPIFWLMFRDKLGVGRTAMIVVVGATLFAISAWWIVTHTQFNRLFERLGNTEINEGVPDTRSVTWPIAWEKFQEKPVLGNGPRLRLYDDWRVHYPGHEAIPYPHSLYLFILVTMGIVGLVVYMLLFILFAWRIYRGIAHPGPEYEKGLLKIGFLFMILFLADQLKIEFLRLSLSDYQHLFMAFMGMMIAVADKRRARLPGVDEPAPEAARA